MRLKKEIEVNGYNHEVWVDPEWIENDRIRGGYTVYDDDEYYVDGELWFNQNKELVDFDGAFSLDNEVADLIIGLDYKLVKSNFCN